MPEALDTPQDPVLEAELDRAIEPYRALLPPELLAELRESLADALTTHPVGRSLLDRVRPQPVVESSGPRPKEGAGAQAEEPPKKKGMGKAG